jgi:ribosome-associated translation inhibitor RaiA
MKYADQSYNLRIVLDTKHCEASADEISKMENALEPLHRVTEKFPVSDLYVTIIHHARTGDFHVKTSLVLPGRTLFTGDRDETMYAAYERCIHKLVHKVESYCGKLAGDAEISKHLKGTHHEVVPTQPPDHRQLQQAVADEDYAAFRRAVDVFEEPLRKRVGRWVQRYPELQAEIGDRLGIADIVEDVFLTAFEWFDRWSPDVPPGDWLEGLIDPVIRELLAHPDEELENVRLARLATEAERAS